MACPQYTQQQDLLRITLNGNSYVTGWEQHVTGISCFVCSTSSLLAVPRCQEAITNSGMYGHGRTLFSRYYSGFQPQRQFLCCLQQIGLYRRHHGTSCCRPFPNWCPRLSLAKITPRPGFPCKAETFASVLAVLFIRLRLVSRSAWSHELAPGEIFLSPLDWMK